MIKMNKTTNIENIHLSGISYPILCDRLEIQISVSGGYKHLTSSHALKDGVLRHIADKGGKILLFVFI